jgi:redox-sensing transcriptional repressor
LGYRGFEPQGFRVAAAFDSDPAKVGSVVEGIEIRAIDQIPRLAAELQIDLGLVAVPAPFAQAAADLLVASGVRGIVNFAPVTLALPEGVSQVGVDLARELEQVSFSVASRLRAEGL